MTWRAIAVSPYLTAFKVPLVIQLTDDEKFLWKSLELDEARWGLADTARHVIRRNMNPRMLSYMAPYDVASNICQALQRGGCHARTRRTLSRAVGSGRDCSPRHPSTPLLSCNTLPSLVCRVVSHPPEVLRNVCRAVTCGFDPRRTFIFSDVNYM